MAVNFTKRENIMRLVIEGSFLGGGGYIYSGLRSNYHRKFMGTGEHRNSMKRQSAKPRWENFIGQMTGFSN